MLVEKLSQRDKEIITSWISSYAVSHRDYGVFPHEHMAPLSHILRAWDTSKQAHLWKMFGEQFILEREVSYQRPEHILQKELDRSLLSGEMNDFKDTIYNKCEEHFYYFSDEHRNIRRLFSIDCLQNNRYNGHSYEIKFDEKTKISVPRGAKIMKVLNKLAKYFHIESKFEQFRIAHSQILNQKMLSGTLCLSIHPLDYMTMSDNTYDWDSCMSWEYNGCYRAGTVEMMNSPYAVVVYMKGDKPFRIGSEKWEGNKKWRELFIVHPHAICNIKGYPYKNETLSMIALEWLRELAAHNLGWKVPYGPVQFESGYVFKYEDKCNYYFNFETNSMYNDFNTDNTCHQIIIPQGWQQDDDISQRINISGPNICVCCGDSYYVDEGHEDQVLCSDCDPGLCCSCCGERWDEDEMRFVNGRPYCPDCFHDCAGECAIDEGYYYTDELVTVYLAAVNDNLTYLDELRSVTIHENYAKPNGLQNCDWYFNITELRSMEVDGVTQYYVNMEDCTTHGIDQLFQLWRPHVQTFYVEQYQRLLEE